MEKEISCCFTGHRCAKLPWKYNEEDERCIKMKEQAKKEIENAIINGYKHFYTGMALGFDIICAEIVLELKEKYSKIQLFCAIPCKNQTNGWSDIYKQRYNNILAKADKITEVSKSYYYNGCMEKRNKYMVTKSSLVIALFNGKAGGTKQTLTYALSKGLVVKVIKPENDC